MGDGRRQAGVAGIIRPALEQTVGKTDLFFALVEGRFCGLNLASGEEGHERPRDNVTTVTPISRNLAGEVGICSTAAAWNILPLLLLLLIK
jgi:hypothetical protein